MYDTLLPVFPWLVLAGYCVVVLLFALKKATPRQFFGGESQKGVPPGVLLLGVSAAISWVMAKSADNTMSLTQAFGLWGGIGYAAYWLGFVTAAAAIFFIRTRGGHTSLPAFLTSKYGSLCAKLFLIAIAIRLFNEVWSNTKVTSQYFGAEGSTQYWFAAAAVTLFTVAYSWRGGLRSSLLTDAGQMVLMALLLAVILVTLGPTVVRENFARAATTPDMRVAGLTFFALALVQCLSYPFHDPVLTDRAFVSPPRQMVASFAIAAVLGGGLILLFSTVGLYALSAGVEGKAPTAVPAAIGLWMTLVFNAIMLTSAGSTLDSTFSSSAKLAARDWRMRVEPPNERQRRWGRVAMIAIAVLGNLPLLSIYLGDQVGPAIIAATTISGAMVMGLAPIFLLSFVKPAGRWSFHLAFWPGIVIGVWLVLVTAGAFQGGDVSIGTWQFVDPQKGMVVPEQLFRGEGKYAPDLGVNIYGLLVCTAGYLVGCLIPDKRAANRGDRGGRA